jgi:hypothetical protein
VESHARSRPAAVEDEGIYPTYAGNSYESTRAADRSLAL